jgi:uncharacterized protein (TIGR02145 family)
VRRYNDGTWIRFDNSGGSAGDGSGQTWSSSSLTYGAHCIYAHDSTATTGKLAIYGYLYNWYAAKGVSTSGSTTYKNICPTGWHVPTDDEWKVLEARLSGSSVAGGKMKSMGITLWDSPNADANNSSGFSAIPGGWRYDGGRFTGIGGFAFFWSATENNSSSAWIRNLNSTSGGIYNDYGGVLSKSVGTAVRCLKD